jgi:two-component system chemotaxis response regulator CheY
MSPQILIIDSNASAAENLRMRLSQYGQVQIVSDNAGLVAALAQTWDVAVTEWTLGANSGPTLFALLKPLKCPLFLFSDAAEASEGFDAQAQGLRQAFNRLQRADLVLAVDGALTKAAGSAGAIQGGSILLVEDSPTVRQFVKAILLAAFPSQDLVEAEDGRTALAAMKNSRVGLIITDLQMPGMDGLSFVQLLRNNPVLKRKPVLVLSGAVTDEVKANLAQLERVQILLKPARPEELVAAVRALTA